jgi:hypothetical protein
MSALQKYDRQQWVYCVEKLDVEMIFPRQQF